MLWRKRMIEEFEWKLEQSKANLKEQYDKMYAEKFKNQCDVFTKAAELQQDIYDKKIRNLEEIAKTAYAKGRNEVLDMVKEKIQSGELIYQKHK